MFPWQDLALLCRHGNSCRVSLVFRNASESRDEDYRYQVPCGHYDGSARISASALLQRAWPFLLCLAVSLTKYHPKALKKNASPLSLLIGEVQTSRVLPTSRGVPFPPPSLRGGILSLRIRERIPGVPVASQIGRAHV